jgi:hypothetical protein
LESTCAKALSKLDPMALFYSGTLAPIYTGIDRLDRSKETTGYCAQRIGCNSI